MSGVIKRQDEMSKLLGRFPNIRELYTDTDFSFNRDNQSILVLHRGDRYDYMAYRLANDIMPCRLIYVLDPLSPLLMGKKLIWREGTWYI